MEKLQVTANRVGKSDGAGSVRATIPREYADELGITNGTILNVWKHGNTIIYEVKTDG
jgi:hypothetical protein